MGLLLGRPPAGRQALAPWESEVVQSGMPLRGPYMSLDMRMLVLSDETPDSVGSNSTTVGLIVPIGQDEATGPGRTAAYVASPLIVWGVS